MPLKRQVDSLEPKLMPSQAIQVCLELRLQSALARTCLQQVDRLLLLLLGKNRPTKAQAVCLQNQPSLLLRTSHRSRLTCLEPLLLNQNLTILLYLEEASKRTHQVQAIQLGACLETNQLMLQSHWALGSLEAPSLQILHQLLQQEAYLGKNQLMRQKLNQLDLGLASQLIQLVNQPLACSGPSQRTVRRQQVYSEQKMKDPSKICSESNQKSKTINLKFQASKFKTRKSKRTPSQKLSSSQHRLSHSKLRLKTWSNPKPQQPQHRWANKMPPKSGMKNLERNLWISLAQNGMNNFFETSRNSRTERSSCRLTNSSS